MLLVEMSALKYQWLAEALWGIEKENEEKEKNIFIICTKEVPCTKQLEKQHDCNIILRIPTYH